MAVTIEQLPKQQKWRTTMNKNELVNSIAKEADVTLQDAARCLDAVTKSITDSLAKNNNVYKDEVDGAPFRFLFYDFEDNLYICNQIISFVRRISFRN